MDDHRWALKVWETEKRADHYVLAHADYHWDCCYDFEDAPALEARLVSATPAEIAEMVAVGDRIKFDSFIAPAVLRGLVRTVHFYCLQGNADDEALDGKFLARCRARQLIHPDPESFAAADIDGPLIFDLCLDLFNRSDQWAEGDLWMDDEIIGFLATIESLIHSAEIVTISMSFNYSGTNAQTRHLAQLVVPRILALRSRCPQY
ncbi:UPF0489 family protein [Chromobacterium piscinae]|uniref:UPF0489 family protein n=1 Tax=Chromobacterium piscinae TaxID=686831 RepID=UPI003F7DE614